MVADEMFPKPALPISFFIFFNLDADDVVFVGFRPLTQSTLFRKFDDVFPDGFVNVGIFNFLVSRPPFAGVGSARE